MSQESAFNNLRNIVEVRNLTQVQIDQNKTTGSEDGQLD